MDFLSMLSQTDCRTNWLNVSIFGVLPEIGILSTRTNLRVQSIYISQTPMGQRGKQILSRRSSWSSRLDFLLVFLSRRVVGCLFSLRPAHETQELEDKINTPQGFIFLLLLHALKKWLLFFCTPNITKHSFRPHQDATKDARLALNPFVVGG